MANVSNLRSGFTGELPDRDSASYKARHAAGQVRDEMTAVVQNARAHASATSAAVFVAGSIAFLAGYLLGSAKSDKRSRF